MPLYRFIRPLDVVFLRGNRLFGESGADGPAQMPPWPSVFAGALRSWVLTLAGVDPVRYGRGDVTLPPELEEALGTPRQPGRFAVMAVTLAQTSAQGGIEPIHPLPADLAVFADGDALVPHRLRPTPPPIGLSSSLELPQMPILRRATPAKPLSGYWLSIRGWQRYLRGELPLAEDLVHERALWTLEPRLGIGLDGGRRSAAVGQLYTSDAVSFSRGIGFLVAVAGIAPELLPQSGVLRLGGDARGAEVRAVDDVASPAPDLEAIDRERRFRLVLTSPGIFPGGWRLPGTDAEGYWCFPGGRARLVAAAVPRRQTVSGWDLARRRPKPAHRVAPAGSVYWFEDLEGDVDALGKLAESGLWALEKDNDIPDRRAEGFNRFAIANA